VAPSNRDIVLANSEAFSRRDLEAMLELFAPDAVVADRRAIGWGEYGGRDAIASYYEGLFDNVSSIREEMEVVSEADGVVVAACRAYAKLIDPPEADELEFSYALRVEVREGRITALEIYESVEAAPA